MKKTFSIALSLGLGAFAVLAQPQGPPGLTHRYSFTTDASDSVGGANGTLQGAAVVTNGMLMLDGASSYASLGSDLCTNYTSVTFEMWVTDSGSATWSRVFDFNASTTVNLYLTLPSGAGDLRMAFTTNGSGAEQWLDWSGNRPAVGQATHIVVTADGAAQAGVLYVNGTAVVTNSALTLTPTNIAPTPNCRLGRSAYAGDPYFIGTVDEFRIYSNALSASAVLLNYQAGPNKFLTGPVYFVQQPQSQGVLQGHAVSLVADVDGAPPYALQWLRNGAALAGQTNSALNFFASLADDNASYQLLATNAFNGTNYSAASSLANLRVTRDTNLPVVLNAQSASTQGVDLLFSKAVSASTATNLANYSLTGPGGAVAVTAAALDPSGAVVRLSTAPLQAGSSYTVTLSGIQDLAGNVIAPGSQATFMATAYTLQDIGAPAVAGTFLPATNGLALSAGGTGVGGAADQFSFAYQNFTGDFDVQVRLGALGLSDVWATAGLMARDGLASNSIFAAVFGTPGPSGCFFQSRPGVGVNAAQSGFFQVNYPDTWLRLQRVGNLFNGYASLDATRWALLGSATWAASGTVAVGLAVSSHNAAQATVAAFDSAGHVTSPALNTVPWPFEPLGPSSRRTGLALSEIMYHPGGVSSGSLEYVELYNSDLIAEDLSGCQLAGSINYTFPPGTTLASGAFLVIAHDPAALRSFYGISNVVGSFTNSLPNSSGTVRLLNELGSILLQVDYGSTDPWPVAADGAGPSLVLRRPSYGENDPRAWGLSDLVGGSPGRADGYGSEPLRGLVINEFLAHTDPPEVDAIELFNPGNQPLDLTGCVLTDDAATNKFLIPTNTIIDARGFAYFTAAQQGFRLNAAGESIYLKNPALTRVLDAVHFGAQSHGISFGRYPDGSDQWYRLSANTLGRTNAAPLFSQVGINELMYKPISGLDDDQYVELYNRGPGAVNLAGWSFVAGISYVFPTNTSIPDNGYMVVALNKGRLLANYPNLNATNTVGNFSGKLSHSGERVALAMPDTITSTNAQGVPTTNLVAVVVDEVTYGTEGRWGQWAGGGGSSLELIDPLSDKRFAPNWADSDETAKAPWTLIQRTDVADLGMGTSGNGAPNRFEMILQDSGECLVDDVAVLSNGGTNYVTNPGFESGTNGWAFQGTFARTSLETSRPAFSGTQSLHVIGTGGGDTGANRIRTGISFLPVGGTNRVTLQARVRWLQGDTNLLMRLRGNWLECAGGMTVPANLGTPGAPNSRRVANAGPAIHEVAHDPILPAASQPVVVTARLSDPDGVAAATLYYRVDPATSYSTVVLRDDGQGGDDAANDGVYSATIPGQPAGALVAFYLQAQDAHAPSASTVFPADAPDRECLVRFGETQRAGNMGNYRMWLSQSNLNYWSAREKNSNEGVDTTFVYGNWRAIYNATTEYSGSPFHTPNYNGPMGSFLCNYLTKFSADESFLGNTSFLLESQGLTDASTFNNDASGQAETTVHWMARKLGVHPDYRRYVLVFMNGQQRGLIYYDYQKPHRDLVQEYFPDDPDGILVKIDDWFEFDDAAAGQSIITGRLLDYTLNGRRRTERYRWNWRPEGGTPPNDFTDLFALVDAVNVAGPEPYTSAILNLIDVREWMRAFAVQHAAGNWDSYGYERGKNMFTYKPTAGRWQMLLYDMNMVLGKSSRGATDSLFNMASLTDSSQGGDPGMQRMFTFPPFLREYWAALQELANNEMDPAIYLPMMDARVAALHANNVPVADPAPIKTWIAARRAYIQSQVPQAGFTVNGPASFNAASNGLVLTGTAPIGVDRIMINGIQYPLTWTSVTNWSLKVPLNAGTNNLNLAAIDISGNSVSNGSATLIVNLTSPAVAPAGRVVFNEIMYSPAVADAEYVELYNASTNSTFDLSGWQVNGLAYTFPAGSVLAPNGFLVLAKDDFAYAKAYGPSAPPFDNYAGGLQGNGETLSLLQPSGAVVDRVRYESVVPWPTNASATGRSIQVIDPTQDNSRVSNWGTVPTNGLGQPQWVRASATGTASASLIYIYLTAAGDIYLDDVNLVAGSVAEAGPNLLPDGDFESGFPGPWTVSANHSGSALSTTIKRSGNNGLHVVASTGGTTQGSSIWQIISPALVTNAAYTISFWYLQNTNHTPLTIRLSNSGIVDSVTPVSPSATVSIANPGATNSVNASLPVYPALWLNEVQADNLTGPVDNFGEHDPWVELYNAGTNAITLTNLYLSATYTNLTNWALPTNVTSLAAGQALVIWCDGQTNQTAGTNVHTSFRLPGGTGSIALSRKVNGTPQIIDYLNYTGLQVNRSYGDVPDGQPFYRQQMAFVTPGGTNSSALPPIQVYINEWMAWNANPGGYPNPVDNKYSDWFELYNAGTNTADLSGYFLTDTLTNWSEFQIPSGYSIPAHGFMVVWANNITSQNTTNNPQLHTNFKMSKSGEALGLFAPNGTQIDAITYGAQSTNISQGHFPDGSGPLFFMTNATPGLPNVVPPPPAPTFSDFTLSGGVLSLTFSMTPGHTYRVEYKDDLGAATWQPFTPEQLAATSSVTVQVDLTSTQQRFYRVVILD